jgi:hypothetical protein
MSECIFYKSKCKPLEDQALKQLRESNILEFIHKVCSMCIKNRYSRAKMLALRRRYVVINTL